MTEEENGCHALNIDLPNSNLFVSHASSSLFIDKDRFLNFQRIMILKKVPIKSFFTIKIFMYVSQAHAMIPCLTKMSPCPYKRKNRLKNFGHVLEPISLQCPKSNPTEYTYWKLYIQDSLFFQNIMTNAFGAHIHTETFKSHSKTGTPK